MPSVREPANDCEPIASVNSVISAAELSQLNNFLNKELEKTTSQEFATRIRFHENQQQQAVKTKKVVVLMHGLYNSPVEMQNLEAESFRQGHNVINLRLAGHQEKDPQAFERVSAESWIEQTKSTMALARLMGSSVIVIGHSTGALIALYTMILYEKIVSDAILMSAALKVHPSTNLIVNMLNGVGDSAASVEKISYTKGKIEQTTKPAKQVARLASLLNWYDPVVLNKVGRKNVTFIDTDSDIAIDPNENFNFYRAVLNLNSNAHIQYHLVPRDYKLPHSNIYKKSQNKGYREIVVPAIRKAFEEAKNNCY